MSAAIRNQDLLKKIATDLKAAAIISFLLVLPFAMLDFVFNSSRRQNVLDLVVLFGLLWLLPTVFIVILAPIVQFVRAGNNILANPVTLLFRVAFLLVIAGIWGVAIIDQLPCFFGIPNCD